MAGNMFDINFRGHEDAMRLIETQAELLSKNIESAIAETVLYGVALIANDCPIDTGRLRASIAGRLAGAAGVDLGGGKPREIAAGKSQSTTMFNQYEGRIGTNVEYALYLEYGTSRIEAKAFFRNNAPLIENFFNQKMNEAVQATSEGRLLRAS
ncbi:MAG TPA: HK97 gp10 family phage protein [Desulfotomaculum sp.]|nr:MAG: hypothetical protein JL56_03015 [Desulfotomaculum sp. BICA1-6]HBX22675.1 HK97 gp10 family phage protein [Desulfotomaculum sp.]